MCKPRASLQINRTFDMVILETAASWIPSYNQPLNVLGLYKMWNVNPSKAERNYYSMYPILCMYRVLYVLKQIFNDRYTVLSVIRVEKSKCATAPHDTTTDMVSYDWEVLDTTGLPLWQLIQLLWGKSIGISLCYGSWNISKCLNLQISWYPTKAKYAKNLAA